MPDVYASITEVDRSVVDRVAHAMELSAADPQHQAMVDAYLGDLELPDGPRVLEIGCGTGAIARLLAARVAGGTVLGVDPSPVLVEKARELGRGVPGLHRRPRRGRAGR